MGEIWRRFTSLERALLAGALVAALAAVGDLGRGDGAAALMLALVIAGACVGAAGGSRKRRLLGDRRVLGPIEQVERDHPLGFVIATGIFLGLLFASANGPLIGVAFAISWIGVQLAPMFTR